MKLNNKRTALVGLAFMSISIFWQLYEFVVPLVLRDTFLMGDGITNFIMSLDNVLALFMLPLFGRFSDRIDTRIGRRMPFILCGTAIVFITLMIAPSIVRAGSALVEGVYTGELGKEVLEGDVRRLMIAFVALLGVLLFAMGTYRSPAVALMPDVTPKALRSKGNAIINLMGALGGVIALVLIQFLGTSRDVTVLEEYAHLGTDGAVTFNDYSMLFYVIAVIMLICVIVLFITIKEKQLRVNDGPSEAANTAGAGTKLSPEMRRSLILILLSVFFWFMGYNAVTTSYSRYFLAVWGDSAGAAQCLTIATVGAVISYIPVGALSAKFGRKRIILLGVTLLAVCFGIAATVKTISFVIYLLFITIGFAWAAIGVNSYPMVVEISRSADVGKYTGYYYTFSMAGQIVTPILSGQLLEHVGYHSLFPYAAIMVAISFCTMWFVKHGDVKPAKAKSVHEHFNAED